MRRHIFPLLVFVAVSSPTAVPAPLLAQDSPASAQGARPASEFCYSSNPLPNCKSYLIFEMTGAVRLAGTTRPYSTNPVYVECVGPGCRTDDRQGYLAWDVGFMRNIDT